MTAGRRTRVVAAGLLLLVLAVPWLASAAPVPSVQGSDARPRLSLDTRYAPHDDAMGAYWFTVRNHGNQTLLGEALGSASGNGVTASCRSACGAYSLAPGQGRTVTLDVHADEGARDGTIRIAYPVRFSNAADAVVEVPVDIQHLEPGRLSVSLSTSDPDLPCPSPSDVLVEGTVRLHNVGDATVQVGTLRLDVPGGPSWLDTRPTFLSAGKGAEVDFQFRLPAERAAEHHALTLETSSSSGWLEQEPSARHSLRLQPPSELQLSTGEAFSSTATYRPGVLGVLDPHSMTVTVRERCGYQGILLDSLDADAALHHGLALPLRVGAGSSMDVATTILVPLERLDTICTGYEGALAFSGVDELDRPRRVEVQVQAQVDLAQTRQRLEAVRQETVGLPDLERAAQGLSEAYLALMEGDACRETDGISDVLAAAPPILWTWDLLDSDAGAHRDSVALAAMAPRLEQLCAALWTPEARHPCLDFANALWVHAEERLRAHVEEAEESWSRSDRISQQIVDLRFLATASALLGEADAEQRWRERLDETQLHGNDLRAAAVRALADGQDANRRWLRDPTDAQSSDYRHLEPISFLVGEGRHAVAVAELETARRNALDAGDPVLAARIDETIRDLEEARVDALAANLGVLGSWGAAALGAAGVAVSRVLGWREQRRYTRLGDVLS